MVKATEMLLELDMNKFFIKGLDKRLWNTGVYEVVQFIREITTPYANHLECFFKNI